jgi:hypothetical protein
MTRPFSDSSEIQIPPGAVIRNSHPEKSKRGKKENHAEIGMARGRTSAAL